MHSLSRLVIFCLFASLAFASCKSKKSTVKGTAPKEEAKRKEYSEISKRLNFEVDKGDNIRLYTYIADWIGTKHKIGGCDKSGIDCSCFIRMVSESVYHARLARTAAEMQKQVKNIDRDELQEGDLVFFNIKSAKPSHVGIYLKRGWFAHVSTSKGVMINNLSEAYYDKYFSGAGRN